MTSRGDVSTSAPILSGTAGLGSSCLSRSAAHTGFMGKLVYGMSVSLDGYVNGPDGSIGWTAPERQLSRFVNEVESSFGIYLFGRRMFETMRIWEDDAALAGWPDYVLEYAPTYRAAEKVVFSTAMEDPALPRTKVERRLDPDAVPS